jgi:hypothetical protein
MGPKLNNELPKAWVLVQFERVARGVPPVNHAQDARATIKLSQYQSLTLLPLISIIARVETVRRNQ